MRVYYCQDPVFPQVNVSQIPQKKKSSHSENCWHALHKSFLNLQVRVKSQRSIIMYMKNNAIHFKHIESYLGFNFNIMLSLNLYASQFSESPPYFNGHPITKLFDYCLCQTGDGGDFPSILSKCIKQLICYVNFQIFPLIIKKERYKL